MNTGRIFKEAVFMLGLLGAFFFLANAPEVKAFGILDGTTTSLYIGYFCPPYISTYQEGEFYQPASGQCTYESSALNSSPVGNGNRYGILFRGEVGSSTVVNGHFLGLSSNSIQGDDTIPDPKQGENFFTLIAEIRPVGQDLQQFLDIFQHGGLFLPHYNFGFLNWKYGTSAPAVATTTNPVIIIPGILGSAQKNGVWVIDPILHTYDNLIDTLKANGYVEGKDLFPFAYDWRQSNVTTALFLKQRIDQIKIICGCNKVDIVAHSMGGLAARQYVQSDSYEHDVDRLIFLGTPHLGALEAYLMWEGGYVLIKQSRDLVLRRILESEAEELGFDRIFDYVRNKPISSVQELLPTFDYLQQTSGQFRVYPTNYPQNLFLDSLNSKLNILLNSGVKLTNIIGENGATSTPKHIVVQNSQPGSLQWGDGEPVDLPASVFYDDGDKTVSVLSATALGGNSEILHTDHNSLPTDGEDIIYRKLTGHDASILIKNEARPDFKMIIIKLFSPIDMQVVAPDGKRMGKNFVTGEEYNEIPDAFYSGYQTDDEYVTIPNPLDGQYKVIVQGTESGGEYTVATSYISDVTSTESEFQATTTPGLITNLNLNVDNLNPQNSTVIPTDVAPPTIGIISPQNIDYLHSSTTPILVDISDVESGISSSEIKLDGTIIAYGTMMDLFFMSLGNHVLVVNATDNVGNATSTSVAFNVIATPDSTISDINRAFSLGWITKDGTKNTLINKIQIAIKIQAKIMTLEEKVPGKPSITRRIQVLEKRLDRVLGQQVINELDKQRGRTINEQGYQLIKADIIWLLNT